MNSISRTLRMIAGSVALALVVVAVPSTLAAQPGGPSHRGPVGGHLERLGAMLDLTEIQEEQIQDVSAESGPRTQELVDQLMAARTSLHAQIEDEAFDEGAIRQAASVVAALEADLAVQRALISFSVRAILTEEQLADLELIKADRQARRQGLRERLGGKHPGAEG